MPRICRSASRAEKTRDASEGNARASFMRSASRSGVADTEAAPERAGGYFAFEWSMGAANAAVPDATVLAGWRALAKALDELDPPVEPADEARAVV